MNTSGLALLGKYRLSPAKTWYYGWALKMSLLIGALAAGLVLVAVHVGYLSEATVESMRITVPVSVTLVLAWMVPMCQGHTWAENCMEPFLWMAPALPILLAGSALIESVVLLPGSYATTGAAMVGAINPVFVVTGTLNGLAGAIGWWTLHHGWHDKALAGRMMEQESNDSGQGLQYVDPFAVVALTLGFGVVCMAFAIVSAKLAWQMFAGGA